MSGAAPDVEGLFHRGEDPADGVAKEASNRRAGAPFREVRAPMGVVDGIRGVANKVGRGVTGAGEAEEAVRGDV